VSADAIARRKDQTMTMTMTTAPPALLHHIIEDVGDSAVAAEAFRLAWAAKRHDATADVWLEYFEHTMSERDKGWHLYLTLRTEHFSMKVLVEREDPTGDKTTEELVDQIWPLALIADEQYPVRARIDRACEQLRQVGLAPLPWPVQSRAASESYTDTASYTDTLRAYADSLEDVLTADEDRHTVAFPAPQGVTA